MIIKVLGMGCPKCNELEANAKAALAELGMDGLVEKITDVKRFLDYNVMMTPALVVNGQVKVMGRVATKDEIKKWLTE
ncbi:MAG: thioredoxin family protein [Firmicutes bacterium]|nr:thioredoxin family protein [Bacillota bacterium]